MAESRHYNKGLKLPVEPLTDTEAQALIDACSKRAPSGVRNRALLAVLWRSGLRCSEALDLVLRDVDVDAGTLRVRHGKGDKQRLVGLDLVASALELWIAKRSELGVGRTAPLFCCIDARYLGKRMDVANVRHMHLGGSGGALDTKIKFSAREAREMSCNQKIVGS